MSQNAIERACPYKIPRHTMAGCCTWDTFLTSFADSWSRWFTEPPTAHQWSMARQDWKAGNSGWEAAHNAQRRAKEANSPAAQQQRAKRATARVIASASKRVAGSPQERREG